MKREQSAARAVVATVMVCVVWLAGIAPAGAQFITVYAETNASELVSVYCRPDGNGQPLSAVYGYGGTLVDATITVTILDMYGNPIYGYPAEEIWIEGPPSSELIFCSYGEMADGPTDPNGQTTFSHAFHAGGYLYSDTPPGGPVVVVSGDNAEYSNLWQISVNSTDIDGDLITNIADVAAFVPSLFGDYSYRADFVWDGTIDLADVAAFTQGLGGVCP